MSLDATQEALITQLQASRESWQHGGTYDAEQCQEPTVQRDVIIDMNDFDEVTLGPWEWDLKRSHFGYAERRPTQFNVPKKSWEVIQKVVAWASAATAHAPHLPAPPLGITHVGLRVIGAQP